MAIVTDESLQMFSMCSAAALAFLAWEILITFDDEVRYIWSKACSSWIKWVFLFARYFALAAQITTRALEEAIVNNDNINVNNVKIWHLSRVLVAHLVMVCGEVVLMARVYALYGQARRLLVFFTILVVLETGAVLAGIFLSLPHHFELIDAVTTIPESFVYFGSSVLITQIIILVLSAIKYFQGHWKGSERLVFLLIRDGTLAFVAVTCLVFLLIVYAVLRVPWGTTHYAWCISLSSTTACRLILNMQALKPPKQRAESTELQFTSIFRRTSFNDSYPLSGG